jgi:hypothetical protein
MAPTSRTPLRDQFWRLFFHRYAAPDGGLMGYLAGGRRQPVRGEQQEAQQQITKPKTGRE